MSETQPLFDSKALSQEWATRIGERLKEIGINPTEVEETQVIVLTFTRTAADELSRDRTIALPYSAEPMIIDGEQAHQIIDLFLRGVNHIAKRLRDKRTSWEERKPILERMAWKLFNLSKLLVGFLYIPNPGMENILNSSKDLQLLMKQSADVLLEEEITGKSGGGLPFMGSF